MGGRKRIIEPRFLAGDGCGDVEEYSLVMRNGRMTTSERTVVVEQARAQIALLRTEMNYVRHVTGHHFLRTEILMLLAYQVLLLKTANALFQHAQRIEQRPRPNVGLVFDLFMPKGEADAIAGDLDERFVDLKARDDHHRAVMWYWNQVFCTSIAIIGAATRRTIQRLSRLHTWR
jgi:hypothetical protein